MKILLVRMSSMGDLVHTLPAIEDLANARSDIELHWLCEESFADIALLHPFVKQIHTLKWRAWRKKIVSRETIAAIGNLKKNLSSQHFDFVLDSQGLIKSAAFAKFAHSPIYGLDKHSAREPFANHFYTQKYFVERHRNAVWRNRKLFSQVFGYNFDENSVAFGARLPETFLLPQHIQTPPAYHIALTATSADKKLWAEENWRTLFMLMHQKDSVPILLPFGNQAEEERANRIANGLPFVKICPKMTLLQAAAVLSNAQSIIGVDTGLLHLANAFNRPTIGIYTATDPTKTGVIESQTAQNIGNINITPTTEEVFQAWQGVLAA